MGIFLQTDPGACLHNDVRAVRGRDSLRWRNWPDNDPLWVITGNIATEVTPTISLPCTLLPARSTVALWRKLSLSTLLIYFTNCQSHLMGEILKSLIFTLTQPRPTGWLSPNVLTHSKLPASLFVSRWHLKTPRRLGPILNPECVRNMNIEFMK